MRNGDISGEKICRRRREVCRLGRRWRWKVSLARNLRKRENIGVGMRKVSVAVGLALVGGVGVGIVSNGRKTFRTSPTLFRVFSEESVRS